MGDTSDDFNGGPHVMGCVLQGFRLHLHRGSQQLDTWSLEVPKGAWTYLTSVAQTGTLAELDAAGAATWPQWWPQFVHAREGGVAAVKVLLLA